MVKVEQSDRDAAAAMLRALYPRNRVARKGVLSGLHDQGAEVQTFAAYREAIMERAAMIADDLANSWDGREEWASQVIAAEIRKHGGTHDQG